MLKFNFKGAIFDLDGTLLDSMGIWNQIDIQFLAKRGLTVPDDYVAAISAMKFSEAAEYTVTRFGLPENPADIMAEWDRMAIDAYSSTIALKPYAREYLIFLKDRGVKLAIATASYEALYVPALKRNGIYDLFDSFTTVNEVKRGKGFSDIYVKASEKMGLPPSECVVFEDIYAGVKAAKDGGFFTVGVYDVNSDYEKEKIEKLSDLYLYSFGELFIHS